MIRTSFTITNPLVKESDRNFISVYESTKNVSENKAYEFQVYYHQGDLIGAVIDLRWFGRDHAGPSLEFTLFGYTMVMKLYDKRHWDYTKGCWTNNKVVHG